MIEYFKKIKTLLHNIIPPLSIIVSGIIATLSFTLDSTKCKEGETCVESETNKAIIQGIACLQIVITVMNQIYSYIMKKEETKLKKNIVERDEIIKELSIASSNSNRSSIVISSLTASEEGSNNQLPDYKYNLSQTHPSFDSVPY